MRGAIDDVEHVGGDEGDGDDDEAVRVVWEVERPRDSLATVRTVRMAGRMVIYRAEQEELGESRKDD